MSLARWTDPAFVAAAHAWLRGAAVEHGIRLSGEIGQPHVRPWSTIFRAPTVASAVYLKICGPAQLHEPALTEVVVRERPSLGPELIARHPTEEWMLLADGGTSLRQHATGAERLRTWERLLPRYAELQRALLDRAPDLIAAGVPDRRLDRLPELLRRMLSDERAATPETRARIRRLLPEIERRFAELAAVGIGPTVDHADLHDNNVLVRGAREAIYDWGDACIGHPFLTLTVALDFAAAGAQLDVAAPAIHRLRDAYLEGWTASAPAPALRDAADLAVALGAIVHALSWYEVVARIEGVHAERPDELPAELERVRAAMETL